MDICAALTAPDIGPVMDICCTTDPSLSGVPRHENDSQLQQARQQLNTRVHDVILTIRRTSVARCKAALYILAKTLLVARTLMVGHNNGFCATTVPHEHVLALERIDGGGQSFVWDRWERGSGDANAGYGITCVLEQGDVIEKGAVNVTVVQGVLSAERAKAMSSRGRTVQAEGGQPYSATAMSLVVHPRHPMVPTLRADVRVFQVGDSQWYGGGCDLTPSYLFEQDAQQFHRFWKDLCDSHGDLQTYPAYKAWCDQYFYIPARKEHRGIGGIFFDDLEQQGRGYDVRKFVEAVGQGIVPSWEGIVEHRRTLSYSEQQRQWQLLRRGRYIEFNLLYDRGVKFGLDGGRVESIMVSAPPMVAWQYNVQPEAGSPEDKLLQVLKQPREWV